MKRISDEARATAREHNAALPLLMEGIRMERGVLPLVKECWGGVADVRDAMVAIDDLFRMREDRLSLLAHIATDEQELENIAESLGGE